MSLFRAFGRLFDRGLRRLVEPILQRRHHLHRGAAKLPQGLADLTPAHDHGWFPNGAPARARNRVTPLIHGEAYFAALVKALESAEHYVYVIGWCITPDMPLRRDSRDNLTRTQVATVLGAAAARIPVRVLIWSGAPFMFKPDTAMVKTALRELRARSGANLTCRMDRTAHFSHCHHQKAIVIDGRVAFVGGIDLATFQGDRWDTHEHPLRAGPNWHDAQVMIEGEAVADVEQNFRQRWSAVTGDHALPRMPTVVDQHWHVPVQIVRTIPKGIYRFAPHGEYGIHYSYVRAIFAAQRFIYIENQYLWSPTIIDALMTMMDKRDEATFRVVVLLPGRAYDGKWDNDRRIEQLRKADRGRGMFHAYCPYTSGPSGGQHAFSYRPTYVHAKVMIVDDCWIAIGSANLNDRGLTTDSEIMAVIQDEDTARETRIALWSEHLGMELAQVASADPVTLIDTDWRARAAANAATALSHNGPLDSPVYRYETGRQAGAWLLEEAESLTLEH